MKGCFAGLLCYKPPPCGGFCRIGNCFPIRQKASGRMRTRAKRKYVVNDRAGCENVPRHILCSAIGNSLCQILSDFFCEDILNLTYYAPVSDYTVEERMRRMVRYTIYIDKLILVVWGFQLFQLIVMKKFFLCTATRRRILFVSVPSCPSPPRQAKVWTSCWKWCC